MSTLQVANIHLESTANNRIQYSAGNNYTFYAGGANAVFVNTSTLSVNNAVVANIVVSEYSGTPTDANSAPAAFANGSMWTDGNYIYVVTDSSSTHVKRISLSNF